MTHHIACILAEFKDPNALITAAKNVRDAGIKDFETYSPFPIHGMDDAMGLKETKLDFIVLMGGFLGLSFGLGLQIWSSHISYPLMISGKDTLSLPAFVPVTFEFMILFSAFSAVFGMLFLNKLPKLYHHLFKSKTFHTVTSHGYFISIESRDKKFDIAKLSILLTEFGGKNIEILEH